MTWLNSILSSLVVRITTLTVTAFLLMLVSGFLLLQLSFSTDALYARAVSDNADSVAELVWLIETSEDGIEDFALSAFEGGYRLASVSDGFSPSLAPREDMRARLFRNENDQTSRLRHRDTRFQTLNARSLQNRLREEGVGPLWVFSALQVAIELEDGRVINVWLAPGLTLSRQPIAIGAAAIVLLLFSIALGVAIAAVTIRPIRRLERDAARVELGDEGAAVSETGPAELRRVSAALNRMRGRLTDLMRERQQIVAAIAHDVRTGLTRMRLRMDERGSLTADEVEVDLAQMEALISDMLAYARAESPSGPQELIRLGTFVCALAEGAPHSVKLHNSLDDDFLIAGDPIALRRLFDNLIENARRYGGDDISIRILADPDGLDIRIVDNGPGIAEDQLESVFEPFQRGEASRNRATGGTGLGLGIARAIARAHGATVRLENRPAGGLAAIVRFPKELRT